MTFEAVLDQAAIDCADKPARVLDAVLTERVRAWSERELSALGVVEIEAAQPFEGEQ